MIVESVILAITLFTNVFELITGLTATAPAPATLNITVFKDNSSAAFRLALPFITEFAISAVVEPE